MQQFFILGRPRSGTTLLKTLFDAHPNVKIPPELPIFLPLYQRFKKIKQWDEKEIAEFIGHVFEKRAFNLRKIENLGIDQDALIRHIQELNGKLSISQLLFLLNEHSSSCFPKKEILAVGDKNPVYSIYVNRLAKLFPEAKFICIVRDFRDNFISLRNLKSVAMEAPVLPLQIVRWRIIARRFRKLQKRDPKRFRLIRYEDLVMNPEEEFRQICEFVNISFDPVVFGFHEKMDAVFQEFNDPRILEIHRSLLDPVNTRKIGLWDSEMTGQEKELSAGLAGKTGKELGYTSGNSSLRPRDFVKSLPWIIYGHLLFWVMVQTSRLPYRFSMWTARNILRLAWFYRKISGKKSESLQEK